MPERPLRVAVVIGEESGDQLGGALIRSIRSIRPDAVFSGVAGARMEEAGGMTSIFPVEDVAVMGFASILARLPRIVRRGYQAVDAVLAAEPDVLIIIDSPGFTHAVAKRVVRRRPALPVVDYVSPSVWAWAPGRARRMRRYVDHVLALLPFEPEAHRRLGGPPCTYVGHPLVEMLDRLRPRPDERGGLQHQPVLVVLPGSRRTEIERLMAPFGEAVRLIATARPEIEILLPAVPHLRSEIERRASSWVVQPKLVLGEDEKLAAFRRAHAALAASGTVTLELGLAGVPMVVAYRVDPVARLAKRFLSVPSIVLVNLILGRNAIPEFLDEAAAPDVLAKETLALLVEGPARAAQLAALGGLDAAMRTPYPPSMLAAEIVLATAKRGSTRSQRRPETGT